MYVDADGSVKHFHRFKTEFGFAKLLSLDTFNEASNGYLIDDSCMFGAEVYVIKSTGRGECLSLKEETSDNSYIWEIKNFSEVKDHDQLFSEPFTIGKQKWKILVYPKGNGSEEGKSLSVFLNLADCESLPTKRKLFAEFSLWVKDRVNGKHSEIKGGSWFCDLHKSSGFDAISLTDVHDTTKGFTVLDSLVVEVQIHVMSDVKEFA
ncbi:unnamed protein product [Ilex paraguariensis]|uniref:MATH domain-containing protein n=1 Tax=Ilex paraguariensis TaxID=185542 RepID=A0ABC8SAS9_9AQUA